MEVVRLRFGCGESAPSKTSKASTQPGYGTRFICGFPAARRRNDGHLVKYPFLNTCSRAASGHAIERVSLLRLGGPRSAAEAGPCGVVLKSSQVSYDAGAGCR